MTSREEINARYGKVGRSLDDLVSNYVVEDAKGRQMKLFKYEDKLYPPFGDLALSQIKQLDIRDDDICLAGYIKTGSHWTYELLAMILQGKAKNEKMSKHMGFLEMCAPRITKSLPSPRILNTHVTFDEMPTQMYAKKTKIVLTMRNPKDVLVSYYNHHKNLYNLYGYDGEFNDYFEMFLEGKVDYGSYFDHLMSWEKAVQENPDHPVLVLSYEDMKEDLARELRRVANFLEVQLPDEIIEAIAEAGQFDAMVKSKKIVAHVTRKGQVGDWRNWFTVAQNETMDAMIEEKLAGLTIYTPRYTLP